MDQRILVTQAATGMTLARPAMLPDRMVLVGEGAVLTDAMITQLLKRGIKRIVVRGQPLPRPSSASFDNRVAELQVCFSRAEHIPLMQALRDVIARSFARRA